jgi:hypothetical protein
MTRITAKERSEIEKRSKQREERLRWKYPEDHGKVVDFITHTVDDGTLYFTVRFEDQTSVCLRYACDMFAVGADLSESPSAAPSPYTRSTVTTTTHRLYPLPD